MARAAELSERGYADLLAFRIRLRRFGSWSAAQAAAVGLTHAQHQLLLAIRGHRDYTGSPEPPTLSDLADHLLVRHHSAVGLLDRVEAAGLARRTRDTHDGRVVRVTLTSRGERTIAQLSHLHVAELTRLAPALDQLLLDTDHAADNDPDEPDISPVPQPANKRGHHGAIGRRVPASAIAGVGRKPRLRLPR